MKKLPVISWFVVMAVGVTGYAGDHKAIPQSQVPKPVIDKVKKNYPNAKMVGFERTNESGQPLAYEVELLDADKQLDVVASPDGKIVRIEEKIPISAIPEKVRQTVKSSPEYAGWTVQKAERLTREENPDAPEYEIQVAKGNSVVELVITPEGEVTKTEKRHNKVK